MSMPYFILAHLMFTDLLSIHPKLQCPGCLKSLLLMYSIIFLSEIGASFQKTAEKMVTVCTSMFTLLSHMVNGECHHPGQPFTHAFPIDHK